MVSGTVTFIPYHRSFGNESTRMDQSRSVTVGKPYQLALVRSVPKYLTDSAANVPSWRTC